MSFALHWNYTSAGLPTLVSVICASDSGGEINHALVKNIGWEKINAVNKITTCVCCFGDYNWSIVTIVKPVSSSRTAVSQQV